MSILQTMLPVYLAALFIPDAQAQLYTVNEVVHLSCSATDLSIEQNTLSTVRGVTGAPCTGYLKYNSGTVKRMCADGSPPQIPNREFAHRACYTLGTNMYRPPTFHASSSDQFMLFICDMYTEAGVDAPTSTTNVAAVGGSPLTGKRCESAGQNDFCFEDCYDLGNMVSDEDGSACVNSGPYWATTCTDVDECRDGVLAECTGPFPDSCTKRKACGNNTICTNVADGTGGWTCECETGYEAASDTDPYSDGCEDTDECKDTDACGHYSQCINTPGSYICACGQSHLYNSDIQICSKASCTGAPILPYAQPVTARPLYPMAGAKVVYECLPGYKVELHLLPQALLPFYGYVTITSFQVECSVAGEWTPFPLPICYPVTCQNPGYVANALRSTSEWNYQDEVTYTCKKGYRPKERTFGPKAFTRTCKDDATWTEGTTCEDVDECTDQPGICGAVAKYCINTIGSHLCSCVPWYQKDPSDSKCVGEDAAIPDFNPCDLVGSLSFCKSGNCYVEDGKARCRCYTGFIGAACDTAVFNINMQLALMALVLVVLVVIILVLYCCYSHFIKPAVLPAKQHAANSCSTTGFT